MSTEKQSPPLQPDGQIKSGRLVGKTLPAAIALVALPVLVQQFLAASVGLVDKMLAGALPADIATSALDGLGVGSYVGWFIGIAMAGLGIGGQALIARAMGAGDGPLGERALGQALTLSLVWGVSGRRGDVVVRAAAVGNCFFCRSKLKLVPTASNTSGLLHLDCPSLG